MTAHYRFVVIDDDPTELEWMTQVLRAAGHEVTPCNDGRAALALILFLTARLQRGAFGRTLQSIRDAELTALVLLKHHIDARLAETGPYVSEVTALS